MAGRFQYSLEEKYKNVMQDVTAYLLVFDAVLEDILNNEATGLAKGYFMPHSMKCFVDLEHDLRRLTGPAQLKQLLPDVTRIAMDDSVRNTTEQLTDHIGLVLLWNRVERLLNHVTAERIHTQGKNVSVNRIGNGNDLLGRSMLKAALD